MTATGVTYWVCERIEMWQGGGSVQLLSGVWVRTNPDDDEEFIDCEPDDDGAAFAETDRSVDLDLDAFDMPGIGDYFRMELKRMVAS